MGDEFIPGTTVSDQTAPVATPRSMPDPVEQPSRLRRLRLPLLLAAPVIVVVAVLLFYLHGGRYEGTDNAYFQSGLVSVSPNVAGRVIAVEVHDNQRVTKGQVLFRIDPAPYQAAVDEAAAQLSTARTQIGSLRANYAQGASELATAQTRVLFAQREAAGRSSWWRRGSPARRNMTRHS